MKKKIISSLLAVAMMMSIAIPSVFAASSDVAGDAKKVSKIVVNDKDGKTQSEFTLKVGEEVDFSTLIKVYENETKLVLDHNHIRYMLNGNTGSGNTGDFRIDNSKVTAIKSGSAATLTIFDNYNASSKARVTVGLKSVVGDGVWTEYAESFTFENSSYVLPYVSNDGLSEDRTLTLNAHPSGSKFGRTVAEQNAILAQAELAVLPKLAKALGLTSITAGAGSAIGGTMTDGVVGVTGVKDVQTITVTTVPADAEVLTVLVNNVVAFSKTYATATLPASVTAAALEISTALKANSAVTSKYVVTEAAGVVTLTAIAAGVMPAAMVVGTAADGTGTGAMAAAVTTAGTNDVTAVKAKVVYDLTTAVPLAKDAVIKIGGAGDSKVGALTTTVEQQIDQWIANKASTDVLGVAGTATRNGRFLTVEADSASATSLVKATVEETVFTTSGTVSGLTDAQLVTLMKDTHKIKADYSKDGGNYDYKSIIFTIPKAFLDSTANRASADAAIKAEGGINNYYQWGTTSRAVVTDAQAKFAPQTGTFTASTNVTPCDVITAKSFSVAPSIDVKVGQTVEVPVTFYPPNANTNKKAVFEIRSALNTGAPYQYAVIDGDGTATDKVKILGVNSNDPGKAILTGRVQNGQLSSHSTINVKATDYKNEGTEDFTSKIDKNTAEVAVGSLVPVSISNLPAGVTVKWTHKDDGTVALNKNNGNAVVIYGKKIGTNVVTATLSNGEKFDVAVTVKAATAPEKPAPGTGTDVPQTGDSLLANLF